jgi:hypothetical protein
MFYLKSIFWIFAILGLYFAMFQRVGVASNTTEEGLVKSSIPLENMILDLYSSNEELREFQLHYYLQKSEKNPSTVMNQNAFDLKDYALFLSMAEKLSGQDRNTLDMGVEKILLKAKKHPFQIFVQSSPEKIGSWKTHWYCTQFLNEISDEDDNLPRAITFSGKRIQQ